MKSTIKGMIGIMLAAAITVILEQYFESTNLFNRDKKTATSASNTGKAEATPNENNINSDLITGTEEETVNEEVKTEVTLEEQPSRNLATSVNKLWRLDKSVTTSKGKTTLLRIDNKKVPTKDRYMTNLICPTTLADFKQYIDIDFEFTNDELVDAILYLVIEGEDKAKGSWKKNFFKPKKGGNKLRLPNTLGVGQHEVRVGYILKKDIQKSVVPFYHKTCRVMVE